MENNTPKNDFVRRIIKERPLNKKKVLQRVGLSAIYAIVFCLIVGIFAMALMPYYADMLQNTIASNSTPRVQTTAELDTESEDVSIDQAELTHYQLIMDELYAVGNRVNRSIVQITNVQKESEEVFDENLVGSGMLVSDDGSSLFVLTHKELIDDAQTLQITFVDGNIVNAEVYQIDEITHFAVLRISKDKVSDSTLSAIALATFAADNTTKAGDVVIALGSQLGINYSIMTGVVTAVSGEVSHTDANYSVILTDIASNEASNGILVNTRGEVVGIVFTEFNNLHHNNVLTALSADSLKKRIDAILSGKGVPYAGLKLATVTQQISDNYDIPVGIYIKEVELDSPAMDAGLASGDVIQVIGSEAVTSVGQVTNILLSLSPGETVSVHVMRLGEDGYEEMTYQLTIGTY